MRNFYVIITVLFFISCSKSKPLKKIIVPKDMVIEINDTSNLRILCYFKGECSFCYGNIMNISKEFPDIPLICITKHTDTVLVNYYMDQIHFKGKLIIDSLSNFYKLNEEVLKDNKLLLINNNNIIEETEFELNKETTKRFKNKIAKQ